MSEAFSFEGFVILNKIIINGSLKCFLDRKFLHNLSLYNPRIELNICDPAKGPNLEIWPCPISGVSYNHAVDVRYHLLCG